MRSILIGAMVSFTLAAGAAVAAPGGNDHGNGGGDKAVHGNKTNAGGGGAKAQGPQKTADKRPVQTAPHTEIKRNPHPAMESPVAIEKAEPGKHQDVKRVTGDKSRDQYDSDKAKTGGDKVATVSHPPERKDLQRIAYKGPGGRKVVVPTNERVHVVTERRDFNWASLERHGDYQGCPPGLARKYNGCTPPGLDKPPSISWVQPDWYLRDYDRAYRYRYLDGYMLRLGASESVLGYIPLLGGALGIGQVWPSAYEPVALPGYYDTYYDLGPADSYRYYDDTIYHVDPDTAAIRSVAALLTGDDIVIGKPMPMGYDVYNVPYAYRDQYYDSPDALYRYSDGYVYQLDPTTRLVQAAIELLA